MQRYDKKIVILLVIMSSLLLLQYIFSEINNLFSIIFFVVSLATLIKLIGYRKDKNLYKIDIAQIAFIYTIIFFIFTYLSGLITGYVRTPYSRETLTIIGNVLPIATFVIIREVFRYTVVSKTNNKVSLVLLVVTLSIFDILFNINSYDLESAAGIFEVCSCLMLPCILNNIMLSYVSKKAGYLPCIIYSLIMSCYIFIVPILPDSGIYLESIFKLIFPTILLIRVNTKFGKNNFKLNRTKTFKKALITIPSATLLIFLIVLVSGVFKYYMISVASNSMYDVISRGDAVIITKIDKKEIKTLKVGDILVYTHDKKVVLHRIVNVHRDKGKYSYNTKGDNNNSQDKWTIEEDDVIGKVTFKIPYIGYPSVLLQEQMKGE